MSKTAGDWVKMLDSGDKTSINRVIDYLWDNSFPKVKTIVLKNNGSLADAEDVFQDGLIALYNNVISGRFKSQSSIETYLYSICKNKWYTKAKKTGKVTNLGDLDRTEVLPVQINSERIKKVLDLLSDKCRDLLHEYYFNGSSMIEIMTKFNLKSEQSAKNKKYLCMKKLVEHVKEHNLTIESFIK